MTGHEQDALRLQKRQTEALEAIAKELKSIASSLVNLSYES